MSENVPAVEDSLQCLVRHSGPRCAICGGNPHQLRDCPACQSKPAMQDEIVRLNELLNNAAREICQLREDMKESWKLVNAMAGQEYWDRAERWLAENDEYKPSEMPNKLIGDMPHSLNS